MSAASNGLPMTLVSELGVPTSPSSGLVICSNAHVYKFIIKAVTKGAGDCPDGGIHRAGASGSRTRGLLSPGSWDGPPSWRADVFSNLETL